MKFIKGCVITFKVSVLAYLIAQTNSVIAGSVNVCSGSNSAKGISSSEFNASGCVASQGVSIYEWNYEGLSSTSHASIAVGINPSGAAQGQVYINAPEGTTIDSTVDMKNHQINGLDSGTLDNDAVNLGQLKNFATAILSQSHTYTDTAKADAIAQSNTYTDTAKADAIAQGKTYTDTAKADAITQSKTYTDTAKADAIAQGKTYTDSAKADALKYTDLAKADAITQGKTYTDTAKADAITQSKDYIDSAKTDAIAQGKTYTDQKINQLSDQAIHYDSNADGTLNKNSVTLGGENNGATLSNVANGKIDTNSKDAVNGSQLNITNEALAEYLGGGAEYSTVTQSFNAPTFKVDNSNYNNVADAVSALDNRIGGLAKQVNKLEDQLEQGLAMSAAMAGLFQPYGVGKFNVSVAGGGYGSQRAVAVGSGFRFNKAVAMKAGVATVPGKGKASYNMGVNFEW